MKHQFLILFFVFVLPAHAIAEAVSNAASNEPVATQSGTATVGGQETTVAGPAGQAAAGRPPPETVGAVPERTSSAVTALETFETTPVGFTQEGYPFRGNPDAPVTLVEWSDYLCPFCGRHFNQTLPTLLEKHVRTGQLKLVFRDLPLAAIHPTAPQGAAAALCVAEQGPVLFWKMHDALFQRQKEWSPLRDPGAFLAEVAEQIGAERSAYDACIAAGHSAERVEKSVAEGKALGFNGTPSFQFVSAGDIHPMRGAQPASVFAQWTEALAAGKPPPEPKKPELPFWAKPEGLAPDPARPGFTLAGDPYKGDPQAKIAVVEFADFQCPACRRHALETQPAVDEAFVDTGKVLWVVKHFPLRMHPRAPAAAAAAECAAEQGEFWEMHHLLYEKQEQWTNGDDADGELVALAGTVDLNQGAFVECFNGRKALERVLGDLYDAQGVVRTTPTFIVLYDGKASVVRGRRTADQFVALLGKIHEAGELETAKAADKTSG